VATPNPGGTTADGDVNALLGLGCSAAGNCWAVGYLDGSQGVLGQVLHWNGSAWSTG
jgi:hypothetical protein